MEKQEWQAPELTQIDIEDETQQKDGPDTDGTDFFVAGS